MDSSYVPNIKLCGLYVLWTLCYGVILWTIYGLLVVICMYICICAIYGLFGSGYISIVFKLQGSTKNSKKMKNSRLLCRVDTHGKGHIVPFAVRINTATETRGTHLCFLAAPRAPGDGVAVRGGGEAHGNV